MRYVDGVWGCKWWRSHGAGAEGKSAASVHPVVGVCDSECWSDSGSTWFGVSYIVELMRVDVEEDASGVLIDLVGFAYGVLGPFGNEGCKFGEACCSMGIRGAPVCAGPVPHVHLHA